MEWRGSEHALNLEWCIVEHAQLHMFFSVCIRKYEEHCVLRLLRTSGICHALLPFFNCRRLYSYLGYCIFLVSTTRATLSSKKRAEGLNWPALLPTNVHGMQARQDGTATACTKHFVNLWDI